MFAGEALVYPKHRSAGACLTGDKLALNHVQFLCGRKAFSLTCTTLFFFYFIHMIYFMGIKLFLI
jgi:hypothetical protein